MLCTESIQFHEHVTQPHLHTILSRLNQISAAINRGESGNLANPEDIKIGMQVEAVFKDQRDREESILDIVYFKPD